MSLQEVLQSNSSRCLVLDGGLATTLEMHGCNLRNKLWSASVLIENPSLVQKVHSEFANAGCDIVTTASYQMTLQARPLDGGELLELSVRLAKESGARFVAASVGSYGAFLADGAEYVGKYGVSSEFLQDFHRERINILWNCKPDFVLLETIPCVAEARAVLSILEPNFLVAVSFQCSDEEHLGKGGKKIGGSYFLTFICFSCFSFW